MARISPSVRRSSARSARRTVAQAWSGASSSCCAQAESRRLPARRLPGAGADHLLPALVDDDQEEIDSFFEREMPSNETAPLFNKAQRLGIGFYLGFAELDASGPKVRRFNTSILVDRSGAIVGRYRKIHLPGHAEHEPWRAFQHLEKRYFEVGDLGFGVWRTMDANMGMCICNDRRWPETYRVMGLQDVEMVLLGYNTPRHNPPAPDHDAPERVPQPPVDAGRRLRQRHLGGRRRQVRRGGWVAR